MVHQRTRTILWVLALLVCLPGGYLAYRLASCDVLICRDSGRYKYGKIRGFVEYFPWCIINPLKEGEIRDALDLYIRTHRKELQREFGEITGESARGYEILSIKEDAGATHVMIEWPPRAAADPEYDYAAFIMRDGSVAGFY